MAEKDNKKKQVPLRLSAKLYDAIAAWAEDDFRQAAEEKWKICFRTFGRTD